MKIQISKEILLEKLITASHFTTTRFSSLNILQGILVKGEKNSLHFYSTNLNSFFHTKIKIELEGEFTCIIEPKKIIEFISLLPAGKINIEIKEKKVFLMQGKTKGTFPLINDGEFPMPPQIDEKKQKIKTEFLTKNLPLILFSTSTDSTRPQLTGVNIVSQENDMSIVSTDGFRLSLLKTKKELDIPSLLVSADFLREIANLAKEEKEIIFSYSQKEKVVLFCLEESEFFSRLIEGDFPAFEKVIPQDMKTKVVVNRDEFLRNMKLVSVFARDYSNIIVCEFKKDGLHIRPKIESEGENDIFQEILHIEGEEQRVAFNFKFIIDLTNHLEHKEIIIEILRPDAPVIFKSEENKNFLHLIMPVRIQE